MRARSGRDDDRVDSLIDRAFDDKSHILNEVTAHNTTRTEVSDFLPAWASAEVGLTFHGAQK